MLKFQGASDARNILKNYQSIPDDNDDLSNYRSSRAIDDSYELLGLIILDYNPISRRNNHVAIQTNLAEDELAENEDYESNNNRIELRSKRHKKKRHIDNNDNIKNKSEDTKTSKILNAEKEKLVENKLIELIKKKLKKHLDGEAKKKNEMIKNGVNQLSKENIVENDLKKTNVNKDEDLENQKMQKANHKYFDIDTEMRISSGERDKGEKRKDEKKKHVEKSDVDSAPKPKRFDVISKELSEEHYEYDSTKPNKKTLSTHGTDQEDEKAKPRGDKKNECINETEANIDKCVRACQRTHEDGAHSTRRNIDEPESGNKTDVTYSDEEDTDVKSDDAELRARGLPRKKKVRDIDLIDKKEEVTKFLRLREGELQPNKNKVWRSECMAATRKEIEKCLRACNRAHEDVCDKLRCSARSQKALRKECGFNCKKVFDLKACY
ncbi:hypothetical protein HF086_007549 [Spodoptera exigua]|uniref:Uncharacterized protein n=1 Tax=Spodoptera exigua TaxID=7107 RepID=A0A922MTC5_SPOEX|nr:hypothetical protein HF086_007549 [Spodoptera exigua]